MRSGPCGNALLTTKEAMAGGLGTTAFLTAGLAFHVVPLMLRGQSPA
ncbi:hypothetical protein ACTWPT_33040 [Nonomuraea sp. 3N208]